MGNTTDDQKSGVPSPIGISAEREFESREKDPDSEKGGRGHQAERTGSQGSQSEGSMDEDDVTTAGGRQGNFSDSKRGDESQWSPGSKQSSDQ